MKEQSDSIIKTVPAAEALRKVPQFNPLRYLRQTTSLKTGEPVLKFDLRYKKMWFRLACSDGRMVLNPMRITDSMAIFEAQVYLHSDDPRPITNFISTMYAKNVPGGRYVQAAQDEALNEALDNAGFGIQLSDLLDFDNSECGSEIPVSQVERLLQTAKVQPAQEEHRATGNLDPQVESVQMEEPAPQEVQGTTIEEKIPDTAPNPPDTTAVVPEAKVTHTEPMPESPVEQAMAKSFGMNTDDEIVFRVNKLRLRHKQLILRGKMANGVNQAAEVAAKHPAVNKVCKTLSDLRRKRR